MWVHCHSPDYQIPISVDPAPSIFRIEHFLDPKDEISRCLQNSGSCLPHNMVSTFQKAPIFVFTALRTKNVLLTGRESARQPSRFLSQQSTQKREEENHSWRAFGRLRFQKVQQKAVQRNHWGTKEDTLQGSHSCQKTKTEEVIEAHHVHFV